MRPNLKAVFTLFSLSILLFSCKEDRKSEPILVVKEVQKPVFSDYHEQYLREISYIDTREDSSSTHGMTRIHGGTYEMGGDNETAKKDEFPKHKESIKDIWVDNTEVTNAQFREFVNETGYVTTAERSFEIKGEKYQPGALVFDPYNPEWWWKFVKGANWQHPTGPDSDIIGKKDHPVVQVSWYDAMAYAKWAGKRLPTEAEYEYFNRAGNDTLIYHWGNDFERATEMVNFYQGNFPRRNLAEDNFGKTAPVQSFPANAYGLYETSGNVWEWCLDTYHPDAYSRTREKVEGYFQDFINMEQQKVIRGGSFLCSETYCSGYRNAARMSSAPDTGLEHTGFRCVKDI
ncbi:formylglycine-generating enzyme family protein [Pontixanthobacter gangjinensis]|uniref:Formylglycine-generating enzyme family protein n=1 Tax=Christiangramia aestuarii TaxID=1028746 RepID=A0A7M3SX00_9FLAO|nr:formylglycine-generating enzyme family protein [Christiangramia aestuarii]MUP41131.1 formylglycine-generating enzyme family protein [Christiangramia aestuarii]